MADSETSIMMADEDDTVAGDVSLSCEKQQQPASMSLEGVVDTGYAWVILIVAFCIQIISAGNIYCFAALVDDIMEQYNATITQAEGVGFIQEICFLLSGFSFAPIRACYGWRITGLSGCLIAFIGTVISALVNQCGVLFLSYSILIGFGLGLLYFTSLSAGVHYFVMRRATAMSIITNGGPLGMFILGLSYAYLLDSTGLTQCLWIMSGQFLILVPLALLLKPLPSSNPSQRWSQSELGEETPKSRRACFNCSHCRRPAFWLLCITLLMSSYGEIIPLMFLKSHTEQIGLDTESADFFLTMIGLMSFMTPLTLGWIGDMCVKARCIACGMSLFLQGVLSFCIPALKTYSLLLTYSILFGAFSGLYISYLPAVIADVFGLDAFDQTLGTSYGIGAISYILTTLLASYYHGTGILFVSAGAVDMFATIPFFVMLFCMRKPNKES